MADFCLPCKSLIVLGLHVEAGAVTSSFPVGLDCKGQ